MDAQILDQWVEDKWLAGSRQSQPVNPILDMWPDYLGSTEYDALDFEDLKSLCDPAPIYNLPISSSPLALELPSPISDYSSLGEEEDFFDQEPLINPWVIPTAFNSDPISPTPLWSNTAAGTSLTMKNHNSISSPESSRSNSPEYVSHEDIKTKKPAPKQEGRKHPSKDCRAKSTSKSSSHKSHNMIEKRYRNNLNNKIMALRDCVPSLRKNKDGEDDDTSESGTCRRWNKGEILEKAINYIAELEKQKRKLSDDITRLQIDGSLGSYLYANGVRRKEMARKNFIS